MESAAEITIRPVQPADLVFVRETTLKVLRLALARTTGYRVFAHQLGPEVDHWINAGQCLVVDAGDGVVLGFAIVAGGAVQMLYVKREFRGNGFGHQLLSAAGLTQPYPANRPNACWRRWTGGR